MNRINPLLFAATGILMASPAAADEARTCTLKVQRIFHAGERSHEHYKLTSEESKQLSRDGAKLKNDTEDLSGETSGILEIVEVNPHGKVEKFKFTVEAFKFQKDVEAESEPFKAGAVITGSLGGDGKGIYKADGREVDAATAKFLKEIFELEKEKENEPSDDAILGTGQPRTTGTEWEMSKAALIKSLPSDLPFKLTENNVSGKVKFPAVKTVDGVEFGVLRAEATIKPTDFTGQKGDFKAGLATIVITSEMLVPLDDKVTSRSEKSKTEVRLNGTVDTNSGKVTMKTFARTQKENETKAVK